MEKFVIEGGIPLTGEMTPAGNKNAALPLLAATLLTDQPITLSNVPNIRDVQAMCALLESLGVNIKRFDNHTLRIHIMRQPRWMGQVVGRNYGGSPFL